MSTTNHQAATRFVDDTCRTPQSRTSTLSTLRQLFCRYPTLTLARFTDKQLTDFCLANNPAPATVKARRARLMGFFAWCRWQKLIDHNPASELKFTAKAGKGGGVRQHTWLSVSEYKRLLAARPDTLEGNRARIVLMLGGMLGLRRTEIAELRASDLNWDYSTVTLVGKGGKLATLGVPAELKSALAVWMVGSGPGETILPAITGWADDVADRYDWDSPIASNTVAAIKENLFCPCLSEGWAKTQEGRG